MQDSRLDRLRTPIVPERVREIKGQPFGFIPQRFLKDGFLSSLHPDELVLYVLLILAANRHGVSFYGYDTICSILSFHLERYLQARNALISRDLIAFDGTRFQVLALPEHPVALSRKPLHDQADLEQNDPATIRSIVRAALHHDRK